MIIVAMARRSLKHLYNAQVKALGNKWERPTINQPRLPAHVTFDIGKGPGFVRERQELSDEKCEYEYTD